MKTVNRYGRPVTDPLLVAIAPVARFAAAANPDRISKRPAVRDYFYSEGHPLAQKGGGDENGLVW